MKPFDGAEIIVAADHLPVRDLVTQTVGRLVWINIDVAEIWRTDAAVSLVVWTFLASLAPWAGGGGRTGSGLVWAGLQVTGGFWFLFTVGSCWPGVIVIFVFSLLDTLLFVLLLIALDGTLLLLPLAQTFRPRKCWRDV